VEHTVGSRPIAAGQQRKACALLLIAQALQQRDIVGYSYSGPQARNSSLNINSKIHCVSTNKVKYAK